RQHALLVVLDRAGRAQNVVGADAALVARQRVAPARPAYALEDAMPHQRLQHRLQMPRRQLMTGCQGLGRNRPGARMVGDINDGCNGENASTRQKRHGKSTTKMGGNNRTLTTSCRMVLLHS